MKREVKDKHLIKKPIYEGGPKAMRKFIAENMKYPKEALTNKIQGTVYVRYDVSHKGKVTGAKSIKGIGYGCDEEALRLVKLLKFRVPKNKAGRLVFHKTIQIHFRLPKQKPAVKQVSSIEYHYVSDKKKKEEARPKTSGGYTITYNF